MKFKERRKPFTTTTTTKRIYIYIKKLLDMQHEALQLTHSHTHLHNNFLRTALVNWMANFVVQQLAEPSAGRRRRQCN